MKLLKRFSLLSILLAPLFSGLFLFVGASSSTSTRSASTVDGVTYVEHWSDGDPYTHNLLTHRYGITAEQLDGFLDSTGIAYDKSRIAEVMEKLDKWIDDHGGTPEAPKTSPKTRDGGGVPSGDIPAGYSLTKAIDASGYIAQSYPWGQCT